MAQSTTNSTSASADGKKAALAGIRVVDFTQFEAGPACTETLAWLGADVIKVEPINGEQSRKASAARANEDSSYFMLLNANKRSVTCNLKNPAGLALVIDLIKQSDILVENFGPGVIERLGLGYEEVRRINPRIIFAQIKGFAPDGRWADYLAFDMIAQAVGGAMSITGERDGQPMKSSATIGDTGSGIHTVVGILAALYQREKTGVGQRVEVVMQEVVANFCRVSFASNMLHDKAAERNGNQSVLASTAPSGAYPCAGGGLNDYCFIYSTRAGSRHWERILSMIGRDDLQNDERFASPEARYKNRAVIDEMISAWTKQHDKFEVMRICGENGVPAGPVLDTKDLQEDPDMLKRGMFVTVTHPSQGDFIMPGFPVKLSDSEVKVVCSPVLGADTNDVYGGLLGRTPDQIEALRREKAI
jgi:formyl-CoA transferase